ncbi:MAG: hypothetical protein FWG10_11735 [Eubacteriaceae bacterium]|nr:hypothetical protein [Eubacteriaceae bacterium]
MYRKTKTNQEVKILVFEGDARQFELYTLLKRNGHETVYAKEGSALPINPGYWIVYMPLLSKTIIEAVELCAHGGFIVCGKASQGDLALASSKGITVIELLDNERFTLVNASLTAEVAIGLAIVETKAALSDSIISIVGGGRIAKLLVIKLSGLSTGEIRLVARNPAERAEAELHGAKSYPFPAKNAFKGAHVMFNTVPVKVIDHDDLEVLSKGALVVELASYPGFDSLDAGLLGLKYLEALGLPGKYAQASAAKAIMDCSLNLALEGRTIENGFEK